MADWNKNYVLSKTFRALALRQSERRRANAEKHQLSNSFAVVIQPLSTRLIKHNFCLIWNKITIWSLNLASRPEILEFRVLQLIQEIHASTSYIYRFASPTGLWSTHKTTRSQLVRLAQLVSTTPASQRSGFEFPFKLEIFSPFSLYGLNRA